MAYCICGYTDGTNPSACERCRLISRIERDENLLRQASAQIIALNSELNNALGIEASCNVVSLMIEERLKETST